MADLPREPSPRVRAPLRAPRFPLLTGASYTTVKRALDLLLIGLSLPVSLPLIALIAVVIKAGAPRAPVLFLQWRTGKGGKRFRMYKFRTMVVDAEQRKHELAAQSKVSWPDFKMARDPRVTPLGSLLRKSSLDELPQLWNVLRGDMSLVGPRPTSFAADTYQLWQSERLDVPPGLTGLWQIAGRGDIEFDERVRLDIAYIKNRSLAYDLKILLWTVPAAMRGI